ncbi:MAG: Selenide, water dikinase [Pseudomonadales bacterium]|nr:Selenide, water dikinase [Pseudomonadales bacterium]
MSAENEPVALTRYAHGGGCGCKIAPALLSEILGGSPLCTLAPPQLLVGNESSDDAAVWQLNDDQAIVATTDFFMPIVDDPFDFGRIAATNALSDIYAMGGTPLFALAIVGMPVDKLPPAVIRAILQGGEAVCRAAGIPVAGGHSIDSPEPIYGLVGIGVVHPRRLRRNDTARPGDVLLLAKPLGTGVLSAALKKGALDADGYAALIACTTQLNRVGPQLAGLDAVHAMTDVTGFGLLGHALEMARGSGCRVRIDDAALPFIAGVPELAAHGFLTGASGRNWQSYGTHVELYPGCSDTRRALLCDPQTSGGLLVSCAAAAAAEVEALLREAGFAQAARIGEVLAAGSGAAVAVV